jgi:hypothetical protein
LDEVDPVCVFQVRRSTWVGKLDANSLPHGVGVHYYLSPDGVMTTTVETRSHGFVADKHPWTQTLPPRTDVVDSDDEY